MNRRKFLSLVSGAVAAVAGGLGLSKANGPHVERVEFTDFEPKNLLAEGLKELDKASGPYRVTPIQGGSYAQAKSLQDVMNMRFTSQQMLDAIEAHRNESFEQLVRVNEAYFFGDPDALGGLNV